MSLTNKNKAPNSNNLRPSSQPETDKSFIIKNGWLQKTEQQLSAFFSPREPQENISLLVIHNISLPAGSFGGNHITDLFLGKLTADAHPSFSDIAQLQVSAHCLIRRDGNIIQYVSFNNKAWHAGVSCFNEREKCNDFSIGIELEGTDDIPYEAAQYQQLSRLTISLQHHYPLIINEHIVGHCDIAPSRKTDPGHSFNWPYYRQILQQLTTNE
ncbi:MAG: 1,6-anhydro-N-acetylmuramyl-L-alanine amidase AmpD [Colwellia sp.]|jgi:AmpD protein|nr:1,6-anhydro-N-acetylmuramyl-L-alanine amidase AmpD [Colwellia sp.]